MTVNLIDQKIEELERAKANLQRFLEMIDQQIEKFTNGVIPTHESVPGICFLQIGEANQARILTPGYIKYADCAAILAHHNAGVTTPEDVADVMIGSCQTRHERHIAIGLAQQSLQNHPDWEEAPAGHYHMRNTPLWITQVGHPSATNEPSR